MPARSAATAMAPPIASISRTRWPLPMPPMAGLQLICPTVARLCVTSSVRAPVRAAARAASVPAWPPPITMTSYCSMRGAMIAKGSGPFTNMKGSDPFANMKGPDPFEGPFYDEGVGPLRWIAAAVLGALLYPQPLPAKTLIPLEACRISDLDGLTSTEARCGKLSVSEDPDDPNGPRIDLAIAIVPAVATKSKPDPLFLIAGGPGQGSIESYALLLPAFAGIRRDRDLVLVDQRGTGGSNRLDCDMPEDSLEGGDVQPAALRTLASECLATLKSRPRFYTTSIA